MWRKAAALSRKEITANFCKVPASPVTAQPSSSPVPQPRLPSGSEKSREEPWRRGHPAGMTLSVPPARARASPAAAGLPLHISVAAEAGRGRGEEAGSLPQPWPRCRPSPAALPGGAAVAPGWRQPVVNTAAPGSSTPAGPGMLSLSAAPGTAERGEKLSREGWAGTEPVPVPRDGSTSLSPTTGLPSQVWPQAQHLLIHSPGPLPAQWPTHPQQ